MTHHGFRTVLRFEYTRTIRRPSFWLATLLLPLFGAAIIGLISWSGAAAVSSVDTEVSFEYVDESGLISAELAAAAGGSEAISTQDALGRVKDGSLEAFLVFPEDPAIEPIHIEATDRGILDNATYDAVAKRLLIGSAQEQLNNPSVAAILSGAVTVDRTTYVDGTIAPGLAATIVPLLFLVVFYFVVAFLGNNMLNATVEEKENRISEVLLVSIAAGTLIRAKILALLLLEFTQMIVIGGAALLMLPLLQPIPGLNLGDIGVDPWKLAVAALLTAGGILLVTSILVGIGAIMPTAKESGPFFMVAVIALIAPLYLVTLIITDPDALVMQFMTYFPLFTPITALVRNAFGSLNPLTAAICITELFIVGFLLLRLAVKLFTLGVMQYQGKVSLNTLRPNRASRP